MPSEHCHLGVVELHDYGPIRCQQLRHTLTGEVVELDGKWTLDFNDEGFGFLTPDADGDLEPKWVNDLLDLSMYDRSEGDEDWPGDHFLYQKSGDRWTSEEERSVDNEMTSVAFCHSQGLGSFKGEIYEFRLSRQGVLVKRFWTTPWLQYAIFGADIHNRWACRNRDAWIKILRTDLVAHFFFSICV